ncbi:hypothetical protein PM082_023183 [Marasmius tenuissimus]|nr:hypothetical protein PM082_023183 [Marasmius tenuissimus]
MMGLQGVMGKRSLSAFETSMTPSELVVGEKTVLECRVGRRGGVKARVCSMDAGQGFISVWDGDNDVASLFIIPGPALQRHHQNGAFLADTVHTILDGRFGWLELAWGSELGFEKNIDAVRDNLAAKIVGPRDIRELVQESWVRIGEDLFVFGSQCVKGLPVTIHRGFCISIQRIYKISMMLFNPNAPYPKWGPALQKSLPEPPRCPLTIVGLRFSLSQWRTDLRVSLRGIY